eukprot:351963-Chlamydomonas_euryale.AAC.10
MQASSRSWVGGRVCGVGGPKRGAWHAISLVYGVDDKNACPKHSCKWATPIGTVDFGHTGDSKTPVWPLCQLPGLCNAQCNIAKRAACNACIL